MTAHRLWILGTLVAVIVIGIIAFSYDGVPLERSETVPETPHASSTPAQIFDEVSSQFGFTREDVRYFSVYGDDRVQYNAGSGLTFAYKSGGSWHISGPVGAQEVPLCSLLSEVPLQYRQACYDPATNENLYESDGDNANYSFHDVVRYITAPTS